MSKVKALKFVCPRCKSHVLECVLDGFHHCSIRKTTNGEMLYNEIESEAQVDRFQCDNCGYVIKDEQGETISADTDIIEWVKQNCK